MQEPRPSRCNLNMVTGRAARDAHPPTAPMRSCTEKRSAHATVATATGHFILRVGHTTAGCSFGMISAAALTWTHNPKPQVRLRECGSELIEVADNGPGIPPRDYQSVTLAHHTSKLARFTDLEVGRQHTLDNPKHPSNLYK